MNFDLVFDDIENYSRSLSQLNLYYSLNGDKSHMMTRLHLTDDIIITYSENTPSRGYFYNTKGESLYYGFRFILNGMEVFQEKQNKLFLTQDQCFLFELRSPGAYKRKTASRGINILIPKKYFISQN